MFRLHRLPWGESFQVKSFLNRPELFNYFQENFRLSLQKKTLPQTHCILITISSYNWFQWKLNLSWSLSAPHATIFRSMINAKSVSHTKSFLTSFSTHSPTNRALCHRNCYAIYERDDAVDWSASHPSMKWFASDSWATRVQKFICCDVMLGHRQWMNIKMS